MPVPPIPVLSIWERAFFTDRGAVKRDLEIMICAGIKENIPVVIGTAGGSGAKPHLEWCAEIIREIAKEHDLHFKMAMIHADMDKEEMKKHWLMAKSLRWILRHS